MCVDTFVSTVRTFPEPTVEVLFDSVQEIRTGNISSPLWLAIAVTGISVDVNLGRFTLECQIVRVLALFAFFADTRLVVGAQHGLRVLTFFQGLLLNCRYRLEKCG